MCPNTHSPICGTNGRTYSNDCHLNMAQQCWNEDVKKLHDGACQGKYISSSKHDIIPSPTPTTTTRSKLSLKHFEVLNISCIPIGTHFPCVEIVITQLCERGGFIAFIWNCRKEKFNVLGLMF